jgi:HSP20 family protein
MFALTPLRENGLPMPRLLDEFKALHDRLFNGWPMLFEPNLERRRFWDLEVKDTEKAVVVRAEIPGFEPADLNVELFPNLLIIKAEKKCATEKKDAEYAELLYERVVELPEAIDPAKVEAAYRNGVLEVRLPKTEAAKGLRIPVK